MVAIGLQMLDRVETLHEKGYLHLDIKPEHFLFGKQGKNNFLYLIDFGISEKVKTEHESTKTSPRSFLFKGNMRYSSTSRMRGKKSNFRDDLESLIYIMGELLEG